MSMPRVLFVAPSAYTLSGLATWLDYLIPGLRDAGWDARLGLVAGASHHRPARYLEAHPVQAVEIISCTTGTPEGRVRALDLALGRLQPELAVAVNIPDLYLAIARRRACAQQAPGAIMSVHGIEAFLYADAAAHRGVLDAVICTNRLACALTERLAGIDAGRVHYASYGVESYECAPATGPSDKFKVLYSGRLEAEQKRVADLVAIVRSLQRRGTSFQLEIAGDGPMRSWLESQLASECASGEVVFHGQLAMDTLQARYAAADAVIITSLWETGPIVAWEAMARGAVVVSSRYIGSGLEGALADGVNALLFEIGDAEGAASALARLAVDRELAGRLRRGADELLAARFLIPASVRHWDECLRRILARSDRPGPAIRTPPGEASGRLDRWLGPGLAESVRRLAMRRAVEAADPGGEWPHAHNATRSDAEFWKMARAVDRGQEIDSGEVPGSARAGATA